LQLTGGDARKLLTALEILSMKMPSIIINNASVQSAIQRNIALYDKEAISIMILFPLL
jgi:replication-associated recombination protein RarA